MNKISEKIKIFKQAVVSKKNFANAEITKSAITTFNCCSCQCENNVEIIPYISGYPIFQIFNEEKVLSVNELLENNIVTKTSKGMEHYGDLTVKDLPTLYFGTLCEKCESKYLIVFCYGEKQPGLTVLQISGIWLYQQRTKL